MSDTDPTKPQTGSDTDTLSEISGQHHFKLTTQHKFNAEAEEEINVTAVVAQLVKKQETERYS